LQPGDAVGLPIGQDVTGLLQQLERTVEAERCSVVDRGIDLEGT